MSKEIIEKYLDGKVKYIINYYDNGFKKFEFFYNKNRIFNCRSIYEKDHNTNHPAAVYFEPNGKIRVKYYYTYDHWQVDKLAWMNIIKNI